MALYFEAGTQEVWVLRAVWKDDSLWPQSYETHALSTLPGLPKEI